MENIVREYMDKFGKDRTHKRRYACLLGVLALLVCLAVFWRLKLVGTAMTNEAACGLREHTHTDECYEDVLVCGIATGETADGAEHEHTADCYQRQLICNIPEHTHTPDCYSDAEADTETEADWVASFPQEALTGDWAQDTVLVAASQAGYTESTRNWQLADDGTRRGYTRYGAWYGNPYGDWNGMFAAFCLHYAGVDDTYLTAENAAGVNAWAVSLFNAGEWQGPDHEAVPGDVVFFGSDDKIESCAVVTDVYDENGVPTLSVLAGDVDNTVAELTIPTDSDSILGYAATADAYAAYEADHPVEDVTAAEDEQTEEAEETEEVEETEETAEDELIDTPESQDEEQIVEDNPDKQATKSGVNISDDKHTVTVDVNYDASQGYDRNAWFDFKMSYALTNEEVKKNNYEGYYELPKELTNIIASTGQSSGNIWDGSTLVGNYEIKKDEDSGRYVVYFHYTNHDYFADGKNYSGTFKFKGQVSTKASDNNTEVRITFPGTGTVIKVPFKQGDVNGQKSNHINSNGTIDFTVTINVNGENATISDFQDTLGDNLEFVNGSFVLTDADGKTVDIGQPTIDGTTAKYGNFNLSVGSYKLAYQVRVKDKDDINHTVNNAKYSWKTTSGKTGSTDIKSDVNFQQPGLTKNGNFDGTNKKVDWTITVTPANFGTVAGIKVTDTLQKPNGSDSYNQKYTGNLLVYDESGKVVDTVPLNANATGFEYTFSEDASKYEVGKKYTLKYSTIPTDLDDTTAGATLVYPNKAEDDNGNSSESSPSYTKPGETISDPIISKKAQSLDGRKVFWKIEVDPENYKRGQEGIDRTLTNLVINDTLGELDWHNLYVYDTDSLLFLDKDGNDLKLIKDVDYTIDWHNATDVYHGESNYQTSNFTLTFIKVPSEKFYIAYRTWQKIKDGGGYIKNKVRSSYNIGGKYREESTSEAGDHGSKSYDITKSAEIIGNTIRWTITENIGWPGLPSGVYSITDTLPAGLTYIDESARYSMSTKKGNQDIDIKDAPITPDPKELSSSNYKNLKFDFELEKPDWSNDDAATANITITFDTAINDYDNLNNITTDPDNGLNVTEDGNGHKTVEYVNKVKLHQGDTVYASGVGTAKLVKGEVKKTASKIAGDGPVRIQYSILVNESRAKLSDTDKITLTDEMDANLLLDLGSIKVYNEDASGTELKRNVDYTVRYTDTGSGAKMTFELPDQTKLRVEYIATLQGEPGETVTASNTAYLEGYTWNKSQTETTERVAEADASITKEGVFSLIKIDEVTGIKLSNAEFALYKLKDDQTGNLTVGGADSSFAQVTSGKTNAQGRLEFDGLEAGKLYYFQEVSAPDGYKLDSTPHFFIMQDGKVTDEQISDLRSRLGSQYEIRVVPYSGGYEQIVSNVQVSGIAVKKVWKQGDAEIAPGAELIKNKEVQVKLQYAKVAQGEALNAAAAVWQDADSSVFTEEDTKDRTLNPANNWTAEWANLKKVVKDGETVYDVYYRVEEVAPGTDVEVTYDNNNGIQQGTITVTNTMQSSYELPKTGGRGTLPYMAGGLALMAVSLLCAIYQKRKREGRQND